MAFNMIELLNRKTQAAAEQAEGVEGIKRKEMFYEDVEILDPSEDNFYIVDGIEGLAAAIEISGGVEQPLIVKEKIHGRRTVIAGHRRRAAVLYLLKQGKEQYRYVPCIEDTGEEKTDDILKLILTNAATRQLTDYEKVQQAQILDRLIKEKREELEKELQQEFKELQETEEDLKDQEPPKLGRTRAVIAALLKTSTTNVQRYEAIYKNLIPEFFEKFADGKISISAAFELATKTPEEQQKEYRVFKDKGEIRFKDVRTAQPGQMDKGKPVSGIQGKEAEKQENHLEGMTETLSIILIKETKAGEINYELFKREEPEMDYIEKVLHKNFGKDFKGGKIEDEERMFMYRFHPDGVLIVFEDGSTTKVSYRTLARLTEQLIERGEIVKEPETPTGEQLHFEGAMPQPQEPEEEQEQEEPAQAEGQQDNNIPGQITIPVAKGMGFYEFLIETEGTEPTKQLVSIVDEKIPDNLEAAEDIAKDIADWIKDKSKEYQSYLAETR